MPEQAAIMAYTGEGTAANSVRGTPPSPVKKNIERAETDTGKRIIPPFTIVVATLQ